MPTRARTIAPDADALARLGAVEFVRCARRRVDATGRFTVALAGGSTPRGMYRLLSDDPALRDQVEWRAVHFFWGDERCVPPDHPDSNYRMAHEAMLERLAIPPANIHRIHAELPDTAAAAAGYEADLRAFFDLRTADLIPRLDLILLGLGADAHCASLFPGTPSVHESRRLVLPAVHPDSGQARITMTPPLLNSAGAIHFLVSGADKADAVTAVLEGPRNESRWPAQVVDPLDGEVLWLLDTAAASRLRSS
jgi:6-phosphogluconolactonase